MGVVSTPDKLWYLAPLLVGLAQLGLGILLSRYPERINELGRSFHPATIEGTRTAGRVLFGFGVFLAAVGSAGLAGLL